MCNVWSTIKTHHKLECAFESSQFFSSSLSRNRSTGPIRSSSRNVYGYVSFWCNFFRPFISPKILFTKKKMLPASSGAAAIFFLNYCYFTHRSRDSLSPICRIFLLWSQLHPSVGLEGMASNFKALQEKKKKYLLFYNGSKNSPISTEIMITSIHKFP